MPKLGCEVRNGKGDETFIFRPGGKVFCIGRPAHGYLIIVKQALLRRDISTEKWLPAVGCQWPAVRPLSAKWWTRRTHSLCGLIGSEGKRPP